MESIFNKGKDFTFSTCHVLYGAILITILVLCGDTAGHAAGSYYVDLNYSGTESGTSSQPFNALKDAVSAANCGDTIFLKPGMFDVDQEKSSSIEIASFNKCGSCDLEDPDNRLTITVSGSTVLTLNQQGSFSAGQSLWRIRNNKCVYIDGDNRLILDGSGGSSISTTDSLVNIYAYNNNIQDIVFEEAEVRNAKARGLSFRMEPDNPFGNIIIRKNKIHSGNHRALGGYGYGIYIEENELWDNCLDNANQAYGSSGWPGNVQTARYRDSSGNYHHAKEIFIRRNNIHEVWGEGIIMNFVLGGEVVNNSISNAFSIYIYIDNAQDITVSGNKLNRTTDKFNRNDRSPSEPRGISMALEKYSWGSGQSILPIKGIVISNNEVSNVSRAINYWNDSANSDSANSYHDILIANNTMQNLTAQPFYIDDVPSSSETPTNGVIRDNIIINSQESIFIGNEAAWTLANNKWYDEPPESKISAPTDFRSVP